MFLLERARTAGESILLFLRGQMPPFFMPKRAPRRALFDSFKISVQNLNVVWTSAPNVSSASLA